jgi:hypothetical protein
MNEIFISTGEKMSIGHNQTNKAAVILIATLFLFTTFLASTSTAKQIKIQEGFETWPPAGWRLHGLASIVQTTGDPGGECMTGQHAAKMYFPENHGFIGHLWNSIFHTKRMKGDIRTKMMTMGHRFFAEMDTPTFNGKKGGGNILTFWHKQMLHQSPDQLVIFVSNGFGGCVQIASYPSSTDWTFETINLNDFLRPTKTMQVWFLAILHNGSAVYLDEVTITGVSGE